jgi:hypothetical protein
LQEYLTILLNDSLYFCEELFNFAAFDLETRQLLSRLKMNFNFSEFSAQCIGNYVKLDDTESYVSYKFLINIEAKPFKIIEKRFSDFQKIRTLLSERYTNL